MDAPAGGCCGVGRLLIAVLATDSLPLGLGIDENTALVVDGDTSFVTGASGVGTGGRGRGNPGGRLGGPVRCGVVAGGGKRAGPF